MSKDKVGAVKGVLGMLQDDSRSEEPKALIPEQQQEEKTESNNDSKDKATYYLHPDIIERLNDLQTKIRKETKKKPALSTLVTMALEDLFIKHGV